MKRIEERISNIKNVNFDVEMFVDEDDFKVIGLNGLIEKELNKLEEAKYSLQNLIQSVAEKHLEIDYFTDIDNLYMVRVNMVKIEELQKEYENKRIEFMESKSKLLHYYKQYEELAE